MGSDRVKELLLVAYLWGSQPPFQVQTAELLGRPSPLLQGNPGFGDLLGQELRSSLQVREATVPTASPCHQVAHEVSHNFD